jgi:hypothetical protein
MSTSPRAYNFPAPIKVGGVGDSYGAGTGATAPYTFMSVVAFELRKIYGDAGQGYTPFTTGGGVVLAQTLIGDPAAYGPWTDPRRKMAGNGLGVSMTGGGGAADATNYAAFTPAPTDGYERGILDTIANARVFFTLRSTAPRPGFIMRQNSLAHTDYRAKVISAGAAFTGAINATTLSASAVTGLMPRGGALVKGTNVASGQITAAGWNTTGTLAVGAGDYPVSISQTVASTAMTADTLLTESLDAMQVVDFKAVTGGNNNIFCTHINGDVLFHGVEYFNGKRGVTFSNLSYGGISAYQMTTLDDATQRVFWKLLDLDLVFLIVGHNGKIYIGPDYFGNHLDTLVSRISSCAKTRIVIVRQLDGSDSLASYHPDYDAVYKNVAEAHGCDYYDMRTASPSLVNYATALAAGLMLDGVHGNSAAWTIIGKDVASQITLPI